MILLFLACTAASVALSGDSGKQSGDSTEWVGDTATTVPPEVYVGEIAGSASYNEDGATHMVVCEGDFRVEVADDGSWLGDATCTGEDGGLFSSTMDGALVGEDLTGMFRYEGYGFTGEGTVTGTILDGLLNATVAVQNPGIAISLLLRGGPELP